MFNSNETNTNSQPEQTAPTGYSLWQKIGIGALAVLGYEGLRYVAVAVYDKATAPKEEEPKKEEPKK